MKLRASMLMTKQIPILAKVDVLVVGAGSAGLCAALAARRAGVDQVMLVERYGFLGGTSTQILDTFYGFFTPGDQPRKVVGGLPDLVVDRLDAVGAVFLRPNTYGAGTGVNYNPERLKWVWDGLTQEHGVRVLLHSILVEVECSDSGNPETAIFWGKAGFFKIRAKRFIDTSGDADFCHLAGIAYEKAGELEPAQTLTTTFRMSNVDLDTYERAGGKQMLKEKMAMAVETGQFPLPRKAGSIHRMNAEGCISTVAVRVAGMDPLDPEQMTGAEREGRRQAFLYEDFLRVAVPGFERSNIIGLSHQIGVRETRRVNGAYRLTRDDCLSVARFEDCALLCGAPIEDHREGVQGQAETAWAYIPEGDAYDVPYRCLVPENEEIVWVAGRCFSATHDAHASCRSMGQTMSMGQVVGTAAALSLKLGCGATEIDVPDLQNRLRQLGAVLEVPDAPAHTGAEDWRKNRGEVR